MPATRPETDSRVLRTEKILLDALFELIVERGYERLTIQNLLDRSGIGRATFYAHYAGKAALLAASVGRLKAMLAKAARTAPERRLGFTLPFFEHLAQHRRIYLTILSRDSEVTVERQVRAMLHELAYEDRTVAQHGGAGVPPELRARFLVASLWATAVWWMSSASALPPAEVDALFRRLALTDEPA